MGVCSCVSARSNINTHTHAHTHNYTHQAAAAAILQRHSSSSSSAKKGKGRGRPCKVKDREKDSDTPSGGECPLDEDLAALKEGSLAEGKPGVGAEEPRAHLDISVGCLVKAQKEDGVFSDGVVARAEDNGDFRIHWDGDRCVWGEGRLGVFACVRAVIVVYWCIYVSLYVPFSVSESAHNIFCSFTCVLALCVRVYMCISTMHTCTCVYTREITDTSQTHTHTHTLSLSHTHTARQHGG